VQRARLRPAGSNAGKQPEQQHRSAGWWLCLDLDPHLLFLSRSRPCHRSFTTSRGHHTTPHGGSHHQPPHTFATDAGPSPTAPLRGSTPILHCVDRRKKIRRRSWLGRRFWYFLRPIKIVPPPRKISKRAPIDMRSRAGGRVVMGHFRNAGARSERPRIKIVVRAGVWEENAFFTFAKIRQGAVVEAMWCAPGRLSRLSDPFCLQTSRVVFPRHIYHSGAPKGPCIPLKSKIAVAN